MKMKKAPAKVKRENHWLTQTQTARACGISVQAFVKWDVQPVAKIGRNKYYMVADVLENRLVHQAARLTKAIDTTTDAQQSKKEREEKLRLVSAQADGQEIKNSQLRKELAPVAVIEWALGKLGGQIAAILDALPAKLKKRNPKLTASNIAMVKKEIIKAANMAAHVTVDYDEYDRNTD